MIINHEYLWNNYHLLILESNFNNKDIPSLEVLISPSRFGKVAAAIESASLARRIRKLVESGEIKITQKGDVRCGEPIEYRDIAVLLRTSTNFDRFEDDFTRAGVPFYVVGGGKGYYARHEIRDILTLFSFLEAPLDDLNFAGLLRSLFIGAETDTLFLLTQPEGRYCLAYLIVFW